MLITVALFTMEGILRTYLKEQRSIQFWIGTTPIYAVVQVLYFSPKISFYSTF